MAYESTSGYVAPSSLQVDNESSLPIFNVEPVALQFSIPSDFVAAQVANNVLILALSTGRILRIDLDSPADIDGVLPPCLRAFALLTFS
jgi:vacuolar protein sorting-associated protein 18